MNMVEISVIWRGMLEAHSGSRGRARGRGRGGSEDFLSQANEMAKALAELFGGHRDARGDFFELVRVVEIRTLQSNHIMAGAFVGFAVHVDFADRHATG